MSKDKKIKIKKDRLKKKKSIDKFINKKDKIDIDTIFSDYTVTKKYVEELQEQKVLFKNLIVKQNILTIIAPASAGKTAFCFIIVIPYLCKQGFKVHFFDLDSPPSDHKWMYDHSEKHEFELINPNTRPGVSVDDVMDTLLLLADSDVDLNKHIYFFDTLKKFCNVMSKQAIADFYAMLRKLTARGATVVILGHSRKFPNAEGQLVFDGVGDIRNDTDELIYFYYKKDGDDTRTVTTEIDKPRSMSVPFTFTVDRKRNVKILDDTVDVKEIFISSIDPQKSALKEIIHLILNSGEEKKLNQSQIVKRMKREYGRKDKKVIGTLKSNSGPTAGNGWALKVEKGEKNSNIYSVWADYENL